MPTKLPRSDQPISGNPASGGGFGEQGMFEFEFNSTPTPLAEIRWVGAAGQALATEPIRVEKFDVLASVRHGASSAASAQAIHWQEASAQALVAFGDDPGASVLDKFEALVSVRHGASSTASASEIFWQQGQGQALISFGELSEVRVDKFETQVSVRHGLLSNTAASAVFWLSNAGQLALGPNEFSGQPKTPIVETSPFFLHNWAEQFRLTSAYQTNVEYSPSTDKAERISLAARPKRTVEVLWTFKDTDEANDALEGLRKLTNTENLIPIYPDATEVTVSGGGQAGETVLWSNDGIKFSSTEVLFSSTASESNVLIDTTNRRFRPNGVVLFFAIQPSTNKIVETKRYNILQVNSNGLVVEADVQPSFQFDDRRWFAVPEILCRVTTEPRIINLTSSVTGVSLLALEKFGNTAMAPLAVNNPSVIPEYTQAPNADKEVQSFMRRRAVTVESGRSEIVEPKGTRYEYVQSWPMTLTRAEWYELQSLFDKSRGRWLPFRAPDHTALNRVFGTLGQSIFIEAGSDFVAFQTRLALAKQVALWRADGSWTFYNLSAAVNLGNLWEIKVTTNLPLETNTSAFKGLFPARLVNFDSDSLQELWIAPDAVELTFSTVEVVDPGGVNINL